MSELKPCPHCGESLVEHADHHGTWWAHKNEPAPCAHGVTQLFDNEDFEAWNRRTPSLPASAEGGEATDEIAEKVAEIICQGVLFDGNGHGCGGFCQAKGRFGKVAHDILAALKAETSR